MAIKRAICFFSWFDVFRHGVNNNDDDDDLMLIISNHYNYFTYNMEASNIDGSTHTHTHTTSEYILSSRATNKCISNEHEQQPKIKLSIESSTHKHFDTLQ